jgi:hypothetical protein
MAAQQSAKVLYGVSVNAVRRNRGEFPAMLFSFAADSFAHSIAFFATTRCQNYIGEHLGVLGTLVGSHCAYTTDTNDNNFSHFQKRVV